MKTFSLTGASALPPPRLRAGLLDPDTWRGQDAEPTVAADGSLAVEFPLPAESVPESLARFTPRSGSLRMRVDPAAEAPARTLLPVAVGADALGTWLTDVIAESAGWDDVLLRVRVEDQAIGHQALARGAVLAALS